MRKKKWALFILFIAGLIILLLPDRGKQIIRLNERHGPSIQDLIGLVLILLSWLFSCAVVISNWKKIKLKTGHKTFNLLLIVYVLSIIGIILSLTFSSDIFLWICATVGLLINTLFIIYALNKK